MEGKATVSRDLSLVVRRCWDCGRFYGREEWGQAHGMPCGCDLQNRNAALFAKTQQLERTISALKGAISRMRKGRR